MNNKDIQIESIVVKYLQGNISEEEMKVMVSWIEESKENKELFFRIKQVYDLRKGGLYPESGEMEESWEKLAGKLQNDKNTRLTGSNKKAQTRSLKNLYKYAAVAIIFVCLTLGIQYLIYEEEPETYVTLDMEAGVRMSHVTLSDGTKITLNASSILNYPDKFRKDERSVFLDGEAFFEVKESNIPFVVNTNSQKITVLGTSFNVMDYSADDYAITTLVTGKIKLQANYNDNREELFLNPGQQVFLNKTTNIASLTNVKIDHTRTWVNKVFHFKDEPLFRIAQRMEKLYGVKITINNEDLKDEIYTGTFRLEQEIEEVLKIINFDKRFSYTISGEEIIIQ